MLPQKTQKVHINSSILQHFLNICRLLRRRIPPLFPADFLPRYPSLTLGSASIRRWRAFACRCLDEPNPPLFFLSRRIASIGGPRKLFKESCSRGRKFYHTETSHFQPIKSEDGKASYSILAGVIAFTIGGG